MRWCVAWWERSNRPNWNCSLSMRRMEAGATWNKEGEGEEKEKEEEEKKKAKKEKMERLKRGKREGEEEKR